MNIRPLLIALVLILSGCLTSGGGGKNTPTPPWDLRLILGAPQDTVEMFLDYRGKVVKECREWDSVGWCSFGVGYLFDSIGTWSHSWTYEQYGDSTFNGHRLHFEYAPDGKIVFSREYLPGRRQPYQIAEFHYGTSGRLDSIRRYYDFIGGSDTGRWTFGYDGLGRLDTAFFDDRLFTRRGMRYRYDAQGRLQSMTDQFGYAVRYERDARGRITRIVHIQPSEPWEFISEVEYRDSVVTYEPDPFQEFFHPGFYSL